MPPLSRLLSYLAIFVALGLVIAWSMTDRFNLLIWAGYAASIGLVMHVIYRAQNPKLGRNASKMISEINHIPVHTAEAQEWEPIYLRLNYFLTSPVPEVRRAALNRMLTALWTEHKIGGNSVGLASKSAPERIPQILNSLILRSRPKSIFARFANLLSRIPHSSAWLNRRERLQQELRFIAHRSAVSSDKPFKLMFMRWMAEYRATRAGKVISDKFMLEMQLLFDLTGSSAAEMEKSLSLLLEDKNLQLRATAAAKIPAWYVKAHQAEDKVTLEKSFNDWMSDVATLELKRPGVAGAFSHAIRQNRMELEELCADLDFNEWINKLKASHPGKEPRTLEHYPALMQG